LIDNNVCFCWEMQNEDREKLLELEEVIIQSFTISLDTCYPDKLIFGRFFIYGIEVVTLHICE
jgi:hypothetical protein